jgi:hypothetical protein
VRSSAPITAASLRLGNVLLGKARLDVSAGGSASREQEVETEPIGKTPADLSWVARTLKASGRRPVIEDFHYVSEDIRTDFSFALARSRPVRTGTSWLLVTRCHVP